jgi:adenylate cyclase, class 2
MAREIEIKLRVADGLAFERAVRRLAARRIRRVHEWNELFDTPRMELAKREQLLRIRTETSPGAPSHPRNALRAMLTFKEEPERPGRRVLGRESPERHEVREEIEVQVADAAVLRAILKGLGMRMWFRYEKYRTTFRLPQSQRWARGLLIELDETPIGAFVELEGPKRAIDRAAKALGYSPADYIVANYFALYRDACRRAGKKTREMLFAKGRRASLAR